MNFLRTATLDDVPALARLIETSVRGLSPGYYSDAEIDAMLRHFVGVDTQLVADGTYYVVDAGDGTLVAAGGWSRRQLVHGGDQHHATLPASERDAFVDPAHEPARIRAFFVHPAWARRGLARRLFEHCRAAAAAAGFRELLLTATLPGVPLYTALGFAERRRVSVPTPDGPTLEAVEMRRTI